MYLHPLFESLPAVERDALVQSSELRTYRRNAQVLIAGDWTGHVYCVASGLLRVVAPGADDGMDVTTDFIRPDDFFLGPSLSEARYRARQGLIAALPSSVYLIPAGTLCKLCTAYPEVALGLLGLASKRMAGIRGQMRSLSSLSSEELVSRVLQQLTQLAPAGADSFDKRITQSVIASYSGLSREVVNKTMRDLEGRGIVRRDEGGIRVLPQCEQAPAEASRHADAYQASLKNKKQKRKSPRKAGFEMWS